jgi:pimeloyl-ACP methyl ester carboxylesterase
MDEGELVRVAIGGGIELDTIDIGPRDAPALVFLHGFPESHRTWRHQIAHLSGRFRCIAPDQRGYRGSSKPAEVEAYEPANLIGDVFALAKALGIENFTVIGHDWGGVVAWGVAIAGQMTGTVTRAVIANAPHPALFQRLLYTDAEQRAASQYIREFRDTDNDALVREHGLGALLIKAFGGPDIGTLDSVSRDVVETMLAQTIASDVRERQLADWRDPEAAIAMLNWYRASPVDVPAADAPLTLPQDWTPTPLPPLAIPTLVLWGMDDTALPPVNLDGLEQVVSGLDVVKLDGVGHFSPWQAPEQVNAALDRFLD